jgi:hypothetical protein
MAFGKRDKFPLEVEDTYVRPEFYLWGWCAERKGGKQKSSRYLSSAPCVNCHMDVSWKNKFH